MFSLLSKYCTILATSALSSTDVRLRIPFRNCNIPGPPSPSQIRLMVISYPQVAAADFAEE